MNQSARTFALTGLVVLFLLLMHQLPTLSIGGTELRHVNLLSQILPDIYEKNVDVVPAPKAPKPVVAITRQGKKIDFKENWPKGVEPIVDFSQGKRGGMDHFYEQLAHVKALDRPVRIAYFGDSFIEGDILTGDLRALFQNHFGGAGVGWVDCGTPMTAFRRTVNQRYSGITEYSVVKKPFDNSRQGIAQRYYIPSEGGRVTTLGSKLQPHVATWQHAQLFLHTPQSVSVSVAMDKAAPRQFVTEASNEVQMIEAKGNMSQVTYLFSGVSPRTTLFGMALESDRGVVLDNFSMRASSGKQLARIPLTTLAHFARLRPYDLIIIHYGLNEAVKGNTVPILKVYMEGMKKAVKNIHAAFPDASILVMSVPDRNQRSADGITTLKEVKNLVNLQEQMAADCHVCFYNFYQAMGGNGSMKKLVDRNMANKDYTHLSFGGGKLVAEKVFPSFIAGLKNYKRRKALEQQ